jgi:hypothetical protein
MNTESSKATVPVISDMIEKKHWKLHIKGCPNFESILLAIDNHRGGTLTSIASSACESPHYKYYLTGENIHIICAWNKNNFGENISTFVSEFNLPEGGPDTNYTP